ncbi:MFS general substrate transporter [Lophiostoma macrostomum CBS 122681]|uniref:MFS general substrate transporter n=1 Tax=Lophiostoma macrostomum CBS 122681 TaxID=1314788 RepID=A0A6A6SR83_9PLEO|nr:MFS general substrate transporter [Lophiostoma macrostomum CBS 122681]
MASQPTHEHAGTTRDAIKHGYTTEVQDATKFGDLLEESPEYSKRERRLLRKLDLFIMSWACYGYFLRLLDTTNITNAYVSGMKEDLVLQGNQYNYFSTFWTIGYLVGQIPAQILFIKWRPSIYIPACELLWAIFTFSLAGLHNYKQVYALRFVIGLVESPFYIGAFTLLGNWYTPKELGKRGALFYSASFAATMFSGYLQAAIYKGLNGAHGIAGWRWLFIMCGVITIPGALWGFFAVPDSPYATKAKWLTEEEIELAKHRMVKVERKPFNGVKLSVITSIASQPIFWLLLVAYSVFQLSTWPNTYFSIYLKSLKIYSVEKVNVIPTGGQAIALVLTLFWGWLSDTLSIRLPITAAIAGLTVVSLGLRLASNRYCVMAGYFLGPAGNAFGPVIIAWINEYWGQAPEQRALIIGICQAVGASFTAWVPLLVYDTGTMAPLFHKGYIVSISVGVLQMALVLLMFYILLFNDRSTARKRTHEDGTSQATRRTRQFIGDPGVEGTESRAVNPLSTVSPMILPKKALKALTSMLRDGKPGIGFANLLNSVDELDARGETDMEALVARAFPDEDTEIVEAFHT